VTPTRQQGAALLLLLAVLTLGGMWYMISGLHAASGDFKAANRRHNAAVLAQAKRALVGYVAHQAAVSGENNPGAFLCPEAAANIGTGNEGLAPGNCTLPAVGRLPWKTLGIEKLLDASGEPLWYVVASGWAKPNAATTTVINSNCTSSASAMTCWSGQLTIDGQANAAVALIIAPGQAMSVQASSGCTARNQSRSTPSSTIDPADYLECYSTATSSFATTGASTSFNDQGVKITAAEVLPLIEGAIADRFEREIGRYATSGGLRQVYVGGSWPATQVLPFALSFADPSLAASYQPGVAKDVKGLLPLSYSETTPTSGTACTQSAAEPRCQPLFVAWQSAPAPTFTQPGPIPLGQATLFSSPCSVGTASQISQISCTVLVISILAADMTFRLQATAQNVGMAIRQVNTAATMQNINTAGRTVSGVLNADGTATITLDATIPASAFGSALTHGTCIGLGIPPASIGGALNCFTTTITLPMTVLADHPLLDSSTASSTGWFLRNKWHEVSFYAAAQNLTPGGGGSCSTPPSATPCLVVNYLSNSGSQRGVIAIAGRSLTGAARPNGTRSDWFEDVNASADGSVSNPFTIRAPSLSINRTFNDRIAVIDSN
jgi:hypothetical protein